MTPNHTALSYIKSKDIDLLLSYVWKLPYKIEIKGAPVLKGKSWYLFFVYGDSQANNLDRPKIIDLDSL